MRRNFFKTAALVLAGLFGAQKQAMSQAAVDTETSKHQGQVLGAARYLHGDPMGGALAAGNNSRTKKSNRNRYSHNAKLKRRGVC